MVIDLRYIIPTGAFFVPAICIRVMFWFWGAPITEPGDAAFVSVLLGFTCAWFLFTEIHTPINITIGKRGD